MPETRLTIHGENLTATGNFKLGLFFYGEGSGIVRNSDLTRLAGRTPRSITMGLLKLQPGASVADVRARLRGTLPSDTLVLTRSELFAQERAYFLSTKPVGIMLYISMLIAYLVGTVILVQVLSTDISNRMGEYAVLKAMGFSVGHFVYGVGAAEAVLLALGGLVPALLAWARWCWVSSNIRPIFSAALGLWPDRHHAGRLRCFLAAGAAMQWRCAGLALADPAELF